MIIGKHRIKIPGFYNLNNLNNNNLDNIENLYCDKNIKYTRWTPFEIALPVILVQERREYYDFIPDVLSVAEAQNRGEKVLRETSRAIRGNSFGVVYVPAARGLSGNYAVGGMYRGNRRPGSGGRLFLEPI